MSRLPLALSPTRPPVVAGHQPSYSGGPSLGGVLVAVLVALAVGALIVLTLVLVGLPGGSEDPALAGDSSVGALPRLPIPTAPNIPPPVD